MGALLCGRGLDSRLMSICEQTPNDDFPCHVRANLKKFQRRYNIPVSEQKVLGLHITITKRGFNSVIQTVCFFRIKYTLLDTRGSKILDSRITGSKDQRMKKQA